LWLRLYTGGRIWILGTVSMKQSRGFDIRFSQTARREILDRLLALNHERHEEEVKKGLHEKAKPKAKSAGKRSKKGEAGPLFDG
jgi:hypothetical protein